MKLIKRNILSAAILLSFIVAAISFQTIVFETERIIIDNTMSIDDIGRLQETLREKDISLTFSAFNYNTKGLLQSVNGSVKGGHRFFTSSGTFSANDLDKISIVKGILGIEIQVFSKSKS